MTKDQLLELVKGFTMDVGGTPRSIGQKPAEALTEYLWPHIRPMNHNATEDARYLVEYYVRPADPRSQHGYRYIVPNVRVGSELHRKWLRLAHFFGFQ